MNIFDGPHSAELDTGLLKNFYFTESIFFQFRFEAFNLPNYANLGPPMSRLANRRQARSLPQGTHVN
jgi:hypothetical protein